MSLLFLAYIDAKNRATKKGANELFTFMSHTPEIAACAALSRCSRDGVLALCGLSHAAGRARQPQPRTTLEA